MSGWADERSGNDSRRRYPGGGPAAMAATEAFSIVGLVIGFSCFSTVIGDFLLHSGISSNDDAMPAAAAAATAASSSLGLILFCIFRFSTFLLACTASSASIARQIVSFDVFFLLLARWIWMLFVVTSFPSCLSFSPSSAGQRTTPSSMCWRSWRLYRKCHPRRRRFSAST